MKTYLITHCIDEADFEAAFIKKLKELDNWVLCMPNTYLLNSDMTSKQIRDYLISSCSRTSMFLVAEVTSHLHGLLLPARWDDLEHILGVTTDD